MQATMDHLYHEMAGIRTGRVTTSLLDAVQVEAYGDKQSLPHVATVVVRGTRSLGVAVYDANNTTAVMEAIRQSPLGLEPRKEGVDIIVPVPECAPTSLQRFMSSAWTVCCKSSWTEAGLPFCAQKHVQYTCAVSCNACQKANRSVLLR
jgi:hypothetical protein